MDSTYATLIVPEAHAPAALTLLGDQGLLSVQCRKIADGSIHYMSSGPYLNSELDAAMNQSEIPFTVRFGREPFAHLADLGIEVV